MSDEAMLLVSRFETRCSKCGASVNYEATTCTDPIGYQPRPEGCGATFTKIRSEYTDMDVSDLRPDLGLVS